MSAKQRKTIKQLKKRVKKINARLDEMSSEIKALQDPADGSATEESGLESSEGSAGGDWQGSRFGENEVEMADEMTEDAEEIDDITDKQKKMKRKKKDR